MRKVLTRLAVVVMLAGSLASAGSGMAGAAVHSDDHHGRHGRVVQRQRLCQLERGRLAFMARQQNKFAEQTQELVGLEATATKAGDTRVATFWAHIVSDRDAFSARQHVRLLARTHRDVRTHELVNGKCH
jgi:hypothetical protein